MPTIVLIASPLVGGITWTATASALAETGFVTRVVTLTDDGGPPFAAQHIASVASALVGVEGQLVLVAHSGAGPLLPAIADALGTSVVALVYVDAGLPGAGLSRLELMAAEGNADFAASFRAHLESGGTFPRWTAADLAEAVPDPAQRDAVRRSLRPRALPFWQEPLPMPENWQELPSAYLLLSQAYRPLFERAYAAGWPACERHGGHFDIMTEPTRTADEIVGLMRALGVSMGPE